MGNGINTSCALCDDSSETDGDIVDLQSPLGNLNYARAPKTLFSDYENISLRQSTRLVPDP